jgi:hypothetical protein
MSLITIAQWAGYGLAAAGGLAFGYFQNRRPMVFQDRRSVTLFAAIWLGVLLLEFYALGPASFIMMNNDGSLGAPFYTYLVNQNLGGQFTHTYGGGHDVDAMLGFGNQYFSLERILFSLLPTWLAVLATKFLVALTGFIGAYKLCRATGPSGRTVSAGLAAIFTVTFSYSINATTWNTLGYSVLPWVIYLAFVRDRRRHYLLGLVVLGIMAATTEPLHTFLAIAGTMAGGAVLLGRVHIRTLFLPPIIVSVLIAANWHEIFYAMSKVAPLSIRGNINFGDYTFLEAVWRAIISFPTQSMGAPVIIVSILALAYRRDPFVWNAIGAMMSLIICYAALAWLPWELIGLRVVKGLSFNYLYFSVGALMLPITARAIQVLSMRRGANLGPVTANRALSTALVFAIAGAQLVSFKVLNITNYAYYGGQSQYSTIENLADPDWSRPEPFRVVTLRHQRPVPEVVAAFYGLDTYDSALSLTAESYSIYWRDGILKGKGSENFFGRLTMERRYFEGDMYDIDNQANLALLRAANVAFIISPVPLKGDVRLVSGPDKPPARPEDGLMTFAGDRLSRIIRYGKVYVYALAEPLPRAFAARAIQHSGAETTEADILKLISNLAETRTVVVQGEAKILSRAGNLNTMRVRKISKTVNGYDTMINAPKGGVLVLNNPHLPFWVARDDRGTPLEVFPVNMVHMAVAVPPGAKSVSFRYERPTLRGKVLALFDQ